MDQVFNLGTIIGAIAGFLAVYVFKMIFENHKDHDSKLNQNTLAIVELKGEIKRLNDYLAKVDKLEKDTNEAHRRIRDLQHKVGSLNEI